MGRSVTLPVVVPRMSGQRWSCHSCGDCCRTLVVHVTPEDRARIDGQDWSGTLGGERAYVRLGRGWALNKRADGACVFLTDENRCRIHERYGGEAKPLACRVYPFSLRRVEEGWQASLRYDCPSVLLSNGASLGSHRGALGWVAVELGRARTAEGAGHGVVWQRGVGAAREEIEALDRHMVRWLGDEGRSLEVRLRGAARITALLFSAKLKRVRGARCVELIELLFGGMAGEAAHPAEPAWPRQRGMLRQIAFAHSEHLSLEEARRGVVSRVLRRFEQLRRARVFRHGEGVVPPVSGFDGTTTFARVDGVGASRSDRAEIEGLMLRYVAARIEGRSVYGDGYYGWSVVAGYGALWLSLAAVGWLARLAASGAGREELRFADVAGALAVVDRAATRMPALGTAVERARVSYLMRDDGVARLLDQYSVVDGKEDA